MVAAEVYDCDRIVPLGDYGYWPKWVNGKEFIEQVDLLSQKFRTPIFWLRGNHEDIEVINALEMQFGTDDFIPTGIATFYIPQGHSWEWEGVQFLALGGAWSIDKESRTPGFDWFPGETIQDRDLDKALQQGPIDVLLCHDAPMGVNPFRDQRKDVYPASRANRSALTEVIDQLVPSLVFHGHHHHRYTQKLDCVQVHGLGANGVKGSMVVFNTQTNEIVDV